MPCALCLSPRLIDNSFPRDAYELTTVAVALGEVEQCIRSDSAHLLMPESLRDFVEEIDWSRPNQTLREIYRLLNQLVLQPHDRLIRIDTAAIRDHSLHPVPEDCVHDGWVDLWADEMGRLWVLHSQCCSQRAFIGVACCSSFGGGDLSRYDSDAPCFPLVGPDTIGQLDDAYSWQIPSNLHNREVTFNDVCRNYSVIGAYDILRPTGGSHYKVLFMGRRSWPLDKNHDRVIPRFLDELAKIAMLPADVVKYALLEGLLPPRILRLPRSCILSCILPM